MVTRGTTTLLVVVDEQPEALVTVTPTVVLEIIAVVVKTLPTIVADATPLDWVTPPKVKIYVSPLPEGSAV